MLFCNLGCCLLFFPEGDCRFVVILVEGIDPVRREKLIDLLDINLYWRMHKVSDGQKRRVQICMGLLHPFKVKTIWLLIL